jgi:hypothetical protein
LEVILDHNRVEKTILGRATKTPWQQVSVLGLVTLCAGMSNSLSSLTLVTGMNATKGVLSSMLNPFLFA